MKFIAIVLITILSSINMFSQGCSDAGFCTLDGIKTKDNESSVGKEIFRNTAKYGLSFGSTRYSVQILTPYAEFGRNIGDNFILSIRVLAAARFGDYTSTFDLSDAIFTGGFKLSEKIRIMGGLKIPFNNADKSYNGEPLPMAYQSSLGTFDVILGSSYSNKNWLFVFAWQQPLNHNNNTYFEGISGEPSLENYLSTNYYGRSGDVLLRVSYVQKLVGKSKKLQFVYSILPVYHLQNDTYEDINGERKILDNSGGLTLNLNIFAKYEFSNGSFIEFTLGAPVLAREIRLDGLPQFALGFEFVKKF